MAEHLCQRMVQTQRCRRCPPEATGMLRLAWVSEHVTMKAMRRWCLASPSWMSQSPSWPTSLSCPGDSSLLMSTSCWAIRTAPRMTASCSARQRRCDDDVWGSGQDATVRRTSGQMALMATALSYLAPSLPRQAIAPRSLLASCSRAAFARLQSSGPISQSVCRSSAAMSLAPHRSRAQARHHRHGNSRRHYDLQFESHNSQAQTSAFLPPIRPTVHFSPLKQRNKVARHQVPPRLSPLLIQELSLPPPIRIRLSDGNDIPLSEGEFLVALRLIVEQSLDVKQDRAMREVRVLACWGRR